MVANKTLHTFEDDKLCVSLMSSLLNHTNFISCMVLYLGVFGLFR